MSRTYTFTPRGVCSREMKLVLNDDDDTIISFTVVGGCPGNLGGISRLIQGMDAKDVAQKLRGVDCHNKGTSCPDQLAKGIDEILAENGVTTAK